MKLHSVLAKRFSENFAKVRARKGITTRQMADRLGMSQAYVIYLEQGERQPSLNMVEMIARKLGLDPMEMLR